MIIQSIKCDNCGTDLIEHTIYPHRYKFKLSTIDTNVNASGDQL